MQRAMELLNRTLSNMEMVDDTGKEVLQVISDYAYALSLLVFIVKSYAFSDGNKRIAESKPEEKETIVKVIVNLINRCN